jgi:hypothetical protein
MMVLLVFIDGVGVGEDNPRTNPLAHYHDLWPAGERQPTHPKLKFRPLDACLGVDGLPQSATGQTALLTGINAPRLIGKHLQGFPSRQLIEILRGHSIFVQLGACGHRATFANAYRHPEDIHPASRLSVTSHALKASGLPFRTLEQLRRREALAHDFSNRLLREKGYEAELFSPEEAAEILIRLAQQHEFTLYEHFLTDILGHRGDVSAIERHVEELSRFLRALLKLADSTRLILIITSDHGNIEDARHRTHTRNPVPLLWQGSTGGAGNSLPHNITEVTPWILKMLNGDSRPTPP